MPTADEMKQDPQRSDSINVSSCSKGCAEYETCSLMNNIFAEPEGEATNLDAQVTERLYICVFICIYVRHSQLRTPRSCAQNRVCSYSYGQ